jgi:hypothetical protein
MNGWFAFSGQTMLRRSLGFGLLLFIITLPGLVYDIRVNCIDVRLAKSGGIFRRSGVMLGPKTWHREHCSMNLISPCLISAALAVFSGGLGKSSSLRAGGFGTSPPSSFKAMMRLTFWYLAAALLGGIV